jgi:Uma2 family endonuclease
MRRTVNLSPTRENDMDATAVTTPPAAVPSQPPARHFPDDPFEELRNLKLLEEDGIPMETPWHRFAMNLLIDAVIWLFRGRDDFYVGGNMFLYFNLQQARDRDYRGPDFFFVKDVPLLPPRPYWAVWNEGGRYPDVILELTSPSTEREDRMTKWTLYERTFRTSEYFIYDFDTGRVEGWRLGKARTFEPIAPNERGWLWSEELNVWLGPWRGEHMRMVVTWPRFYDRDCNLVPTDHERADAAQQRAEAAEAELARLREQLARQGGA